MKLQQIERFDLQVARAALDEARQIRSGVARRVVRVQAPTSFGGSMKNRPAFTLQARQELLAVTVAVNIGGVEEIHAHIERAVQRLQRVAIVDWPPRPANRPRAEADSGNIEPRAAELAILHGGEA